MIIHLKPWAIGRNLFGQQGLFRQAYFENGDRVKEGDIVLLPENGWYIERPFKPEFLSLLAETPESLMFKVDLLLIDMDKYVVEEPFMFPDHDL